MTHPPEQTGPPAGDSLARELLEIIARGAAAALDDRAFDALARRVFAAQFEACAPLRAFCERRGRTPATVRSWLEIPAVPTEAFKEVALTSDREPVERVFETSGTTRALSGKHHLSARALELYRASMQATFRRFVLPELEAQVTSAAKSVLVPLVVGPPLEQAAHSSLAFMIDGVCRALCAAPARHFLGPAGLDEDGLARALGDAERDGRPVLLLGTSLAFLEVIERWAARGLRFYLPPGSRAMETGGAKGRRRELAPGEVRALMARTFGLDESHVVTEYGMTEACSQFYDQALVGRWRAERDGCAVDAPPDPAERSLVGPPWARALVCDAETLEPAPPGAVGVLRIVDLANRFTVSFLQTADLATAPAPGPEGPGTAPVALSGRARDAEARGCSLAAEEWARVTRAESRGPGR
jgi:hypothetical protein